MRQPGWGVILDELYRAGMASEIIDYPEEYAQWKRSDEEHKPPEVIIAEGEDMFDKLEHLSDVTGYDMEVIDEKLIEMSHMGLVDRDPIRLTTKGFEVAHDRELREKRFNLNFLLMLFTVIIALATVLNGFPDEETRFYGGIVLLILIPVVLLFAKREIS